MGKIRILLVDSQTLFREGIKALLSGGETVEVAGEVPAHRDVVAAVASDSPDVVLMEVAGERGASAAAVQSIRKCSPRTKVAFLTMRRDEHALAEYRDSGASGYILKDTGPEDLLDAIYTIHKGGISISAPVLAQITEANPRPRQSNLTPRENEVLRLTAEGNSVKGIASMLDLSAKTVDAHKVNLMRKLRIHNKAQLIHFAFENQIVKLSFSAH